MKILLVSSASFGFKTLLVHQIDYFKSRGLIVDITCSPDEGADDLARNGYTVHQIPIARKIAPISNLKSIIQLYQLMRANDYDLVHVHSPVAALLGRIAAKMAGVKRIVYTAHGFKFNDKMSATEYQFYYSIEKFAATITDLIWTQSWEDFQTAKNTQLIATDKLRHLGNGIDIDKFSRGRLPDHTRSILLAELGIPEDRLIIGIVARITFIKGHGALIDAFAKLQTQFDNLHLLIVGGQLKSERDSYQTEVEAAIDRHQLRDRVTITGMRTDIPELLTTMDILSLPSHWEGLPRAVIEGMAMELPVVATDIRGCREAVVDGETGLIVPPQDSESLAEALAKLVANPSLRQSFGTAGRKRAEIEFDERNVFKRLADGYVDLGITFLS
jgi:glycosyltransferase involved in cell wall biosynthesis